MITIEPLFGLSNRMQALDAALSLSRQCRLPLRLIWNKNADLNCGFDELFQVPSEIKYLLQPERPFFKHYAGPLLSLGLPEFPLDERLNNFTILKSLLNVLESFGMHRLRNGLLYALRRVNQRVFTHRGYERAIYPDEMFLLVQQKYDFAALRKYRTIYIQGCVYFLNDLPALDSFQPVAALNAVIANISSSFDAHTVGIHIRRTDHVPSINKSPTSQFISEMKKELARNPDAKFFLATDSPAEERTVKSIFLDKVIIYEKTSLNRNDPQAIKDALVDLYCLSKTSKILASYESTFSCTAAILGKIPHQLILAE
jgi:hypothetical protein